MREWQPILSGRLARREALALAGRLAEQVAAGLEATDDPSLGMGLAGRALFLAASADVGLSEPTLKWVALDRATDLVTNVVPDVTLMNGLAGVGWVMRFLDDQADLTEFNVVLAAILSTKGDAPGLVDGVAGVALYCLDDGDRDFASTMSQLCVDRLFETAQRREGQFSWLTPCWRLPAGLRANFPTGAYEFGLAHGAAGVVRLLSWASSTNPRAEILLRGVTAWLLSMRNLDGVATEFPPMLGADGKASHERCRSAWCSGDAAIGFAIILAGRRLKNPKMERLGLSIASTAASRPIHYSRVVDVTLCHGGFGQSLLMQHLYRCTGEDVFRNAALQWCNWSMNALANGGPVEDDGLMIGASGFGLALLAAATDQPPAWDHALALSEPLDENQFCSG